MIIIDIFLLVMLCATFVLAFILVNSVVRDEKKRRASTPHSKIICFFLDKKDIRC